MEHSRIRSNIEKRGASGIGPMVIFISIILVSSIAAGLILSTGFDLASQSRQTSNMVQDYASSKFEVVGVILVDVEMDQDIEELYMNVRIAPGSEFLNLNKASITISTESKWSELMYTSSLTGEDSTHFNCEKASSSSGGSGASGEIYDPNDEFSLTSPMMDGEAIVQLHVNLESALGDEVDPNTTMNVEISTGASSPAISVFTIPPVIISELMHIE